MNLVRFIGTRKMRDKALYFIRDLFILTGRSWNDFYGWMLDFQNRQMTLDDILSKPKNSGRAKGLWDWGRGEYYYEYLTRHGLKPSGTVVDFGCGYGRAAIPVLQAQEKGGHYIGIELSKRRLLMANEWVAREGLTEKSYEFVYSTDNLMPYIKDNSVDIFWVISVFNHMPDAELDQCLEAMYRTLKPGGKVFTFYQVDDHGVDVSVKTFPRTDEDMVRRVERVGFRQSLMDDYEDDIGSAHEQHIRMMLAIKPE